MSAAILSVITNPRAFYEKKAGDPENLMIPVLIVLIQGIFGSISGYVVGNLTARIYPEIQGYSAVLGIFSIIGAIIGAFIFWVVITAIFYLISMAFKGEGNFRRTLEFVGFGSIPLAIGALISGILILIYAPGITVPVVTDPMELAPAITALMHQPVFLLSSLIGIIVMAWSANIWIFAMRVARNLPSRDAAITVVVPVALFILYEVINLGLLS